MAAFTKPNSPWQLSSERSWSRNRHRASVRQFTNGHQKWEGVQYGCASCPCQLPNARNQELLTFFPPNMKLVHVEEDKEKAPFLCINMCSS